MGQKVQGTEDLYGSYMRAWQHMQDVARELFGAYGFDMIETPAIEQVDTFVHGIGESTDVVRKEMFRVVSGALFGDLLEKGTEAGLKPRQRMAMRPEGTAGVVRAAVENNLVPQGAAPAKLWYAEAMFRGERPQKGRLRQFHQVGVEWLGASDPASDAECIIMLMEFFKRLGFDPSKLHLYINSMGDGACRPAYRDKVRAFILDHKDEMCEDCLERAEINPLRAFDCKNPGCAEVMEGAPKISDYLCDDCREHYQAVKTYLDGAGISYIEDPTLVRGLDYYTRTVFEVQVDQGMGSQNAIGGGGRYDKLAEEVGGRPTPGFGFALGYERCALAIQAAGQAFPSAQHCDIFVACVDDSVRAEAFSLVQACRDAGVTAEMDHQHRSLKSQFKLADKVGSRMVAVLGPDELAAGQVKVRNMATHHERLVKLDQAKALLAQFGGEPFGGAHASIEDVFAGEE